MSMSTKLSKYPVGMSDLLETICDTHEPYEMPFENAKKAHAGRFKFYGLIRALIINDHTLAKSASRLELKIIGPGKNILRIGFPADEAESAFYAAHAQKHAKDVTGE